MAETAAPPSSTPVEPNASTSSAETISFAANPDSHLDENRSQPVHPALATSKRKFHKLLENLTKPRNSKRSLDTVSNPTDSPAKRIRLEARARLEANGPASKTVGAHVQSELLRARLEAARIVSPRDTAGDKKQTPREPNYVPWSHEAFLRRLKTFADLQLWTSKPTSVNEVAWAKRGWVCVGLNTVSCRGGCEQRVVVGLRPSKKDEDGNEIADSEDYELEVDEELVRRVEELIVQGHEEGCLWRDSGCRDDIYHLSIAKPSVWQPQLRDRYNSLTEISALLPSASMLRPPFDIGKIANILPPDLLVLETKTSPSTNDSQEAADAPRNKPNHVALAFALLGWTGNHDAPGYALATCESCFRRLGLWLYAAQTSSNSGSASGGMEGLGGANEEKDNTEAASEQSGPMILDLLNNHRDYCPWVNGSSQAMPGSMAGLSAYEVLRKCIENDAGFRGVMVGHESSTGRDSAHGVSSEGVNEAAETEMSSAAATSGSKEDIEKEDRARFARLKELSKVIRSKGLGISSNLRRASIVNQSQSSSAGLL